MLLARTVRRVPLRSHVFVSRRGKQASRSFALSFPCLSDASDAFSDIWYGCSRSFPVGDLPPHHPDGVVQGEVVRGPNHEESRQHRQQAQASEGGRSHGFVCSVQACLRRRRRRMLSAMPTLPRPQLVKPTQVNIASKGPGGGRTIHESQAISSDARWMPR